MRPIDNSHRMSSSPGGIKARGHELDSNQSEAGVQRAHRMTAGQDMAALSVLELNRLVRRLPAHRFVPV